jgi:hypothetical protein
MTTPASRPVSMARGNGLHDSSLGKVNIPMTQNQPSEADWKNYKSIVYELRERYLNERNKEVAAILNRDSNTPTENFWDANERMREIEGIISNCLDNHRRSGMLNNLMLMYYHQMITDDDLNGFSEEVRRRIPALVDIQNQAKQAAPPNR